MRVLVGLLMAPLLLGLAIARPRRTGVWFGATVAAGIVLFAVLLLAT